MLALSALMAVDCVKVVLLTPELLLLALVPLLLLMPELLLLVLMLRLLFGSADVPGLLIPELLLLALMPLLLFWSAAVHLGRIKWVYEILRVENNGSTTEVAPTLPLVLCISLEELKYVIRNMTL